ncbi:ABC transporter permease [Nakamurella sp. PAMC28650]|jgi:ribose transport system permease protein|uniref:ABC transporter permease n=1 Tax=Nakamurella sp. PAMC28650 TaxID=2762325 RepID=UPI00164E23AC|nr:ABC transporter permease [Nakamurella sp. PAMC28650]QNK81681.1 ABC transporter permease [Nakamurella sp. PAMC28650]
MSVISKPSAPVGLDGEEHESLLKRLTNLQSVWILGVLVVIVAFFAIKGGGKFFSADNFSQISQNISVLAILGVGMTFIIITSGIDLSVGSVLVFASVISAQVIQAMGGSSGGAITVGVLAGLVAGGAWGFVNGFLVAKAKVPPFIVTLGTLSAALGLAQVRTSGLNITLDDSSLTDFGIYTRVLGIPALPFVALIVVILGGILLHRTKFGRYTYAIGSNAEAARRVGVKVDKHLILVYSFAGVLAGIGGALYLAQYGTTTIAGQSLTNLNVIAAVVIGGTSVFGGEGSMFGTIVGLFIPAVLQSGFVIIGVQPFWQGVAVGIVLIAAVYIDQTRRAAALRGAKSSKRLGKQPSGRK